jgi:hypothetical protein
VLRLVQMTTLSFAAPGSVIGLMLFSIYINVPILLLYVVTSHVAFVDLGWAPFVLALVAGVLLPQASTLVSNFTTMTASLRELIDKQRRTVSYFALQQAKYDGYFNLIEFLVGLGLTLFCFLTGYLIPYVFSKEQIGLFLLYLNVVLMILIFALSL